MVHVYSFADKSGEAIIIQRGNEFVIDLYGSDKCNCFLTATYLAKLDESEVWHEVYDHEEKKTILSRRGESGYLEVMKWMAENSKEGDERYEYFRIDEEHRLMWFFCDEPHGKRMLGINKNFDGTYDNCLTEITRLTLYKNKCANWKKISNMFRRAFPDMPIEIKEV